MSGWRKKKHLQEPQGRRQRGRSLFFFFFSFKTLENSVKERLESTEAGHWPRLTPRSSRDLKINRQYLEHRHSQQVEGGDCSFLCGTSGVTSGVTYPVFGIPGQEG